MKQEAIIKADLRQAVEALQVQVEHVGDAENRRELPGARVDGSKFLLTER